MVEGRIWEDMSRGEKKITIDKELVQVGSNVLETCSSIIPGVMSFDWFNILHIPI
jgi:hypothetical protein